MYEFIYHRPATLEQARDLLAADDDAKLLAGGMTLLPTMKLRLAAPSALIDLSAVPGLRDIAAGSNTIEVGAMARHADVAANEDIHRNLPALAALAAGIGDPQVRNSGTLGGSLANNDPAADYPAAVLALDAIIVTDRREIAADDYFRGMFETALAPAEIVVSVRFPVPERAGYARFAHPASRYAMAGVMVAATAGGVRVAVTGAGPCVFRVPELEQALERSFAADAIDGIRVSPDGLNSDLHADAGYRAHLVTVMARRAVDAARSDHA